MHDCDNDVICLWLDASVHDQQVTTEYPGVPHGIPIGADKVGRSGARYQVFI